MKQMKPLDIYIMEKDSKKFYIYNTQTQLVSINNIACATNFPHNFQSIQVGYIDTKVFIIGGGDFNSLADSMFQINQIVKSGDGYNYQAKSKMKYARHGHSCCGLGENYIIVTGSRKDVDRAPFRTELYDTRSDRWVELGDIKAGRHYHSSCSFQSSHVYIFCGISNETKKYLNTIERLAFNPSDIEGTKQNQWETLQVQDLLLLTARQGAGVC
jgi:hypothetical protein